MCLNNSQGAFQSVALYDRKEPTKVRKVLNFIDWYVLFCLFRNEITETT